MWVLSRLEVASVSRARADDHLERIRNDIRRWDLFEHASDEISCRATTPVAVAASVRPASGCLAAALLRGARRRRQVMLCLRVRTLSWSAEQAEALRLICQGVSHDDEAGDGHHQELDFAETVCSRAIGTMSSTRADK